MYQSVTEDRFSNITLRVRNQVHHENERLSSVIYRLPPMVTRMRPAWRFGERRGGRPKNHTPHPLPRGLSRHGQAADRRTSKSSIRNSLSHFTAKGAHLYAEHSPERFKLFWKYQMRRVTGCTVPMIVLTALAQPALARSYLNCSTRKVVMINAPSGDTSSTREEEVAFVIDEATKTLTFSDNRPLTVTRLDKYWISANRDGIFHELDRRNGTLSYASSITKDGVTTTIVGSGRCEVAPAPMR